MTNLTDKEIKVSKFLRLIMNSKTISLCRLSIIDAHQSQIDCTLTMSRDSFKRINWKFILYSGSNKLFGSNDNIKWDLACYDYIRDLECENEMSFVRLCFKLNTQKANTEPTVILKHYAIYLGDWYLVNCFSIHLSEIPLLDQVVPKNLKNDVNNCNN